ncbi:TonB-dependent hemoglobin/transferrin/lactoferrin family receptor [Pasteurellaceae bacterium LIM206]|nr:TonB-dependent hemoglobin/transferrin/lactoferrin family receptor [Pasteurellaceae bacterium LIM206]
MLSAYHIPPAFAEENNTQLDTISVSGNADSEPDVREKKVGETKISAKRISKQQVADSKDLVRYETGITVVENGRFGNSGYAIRGVDENRVAIMIDGLRQAETISSQGFKELFESYGNFNNTRNGIEPENIQTATITKGADSNKAGSGALGGSVIFETKDARDYLIDKDYYVGLKRGYQSRDNQNMSSVTLAGKYKWFDALVVHTQRKGHELENYFYDIYGSEEEDRNAVGKTREKTDPYHITRNSTLIKFGFQPNDLNHLSVTLDDSKLHSKGEDLSYTLRSSQYNKTYTLGERLTDDHSHRRNVQFIYENFYQTPLWDHVKLTYSSQKITNNARTDEYCNSDTKCVNVANPQGFHLEQKNGIYSIVDKNGQEVTAEPGLYGFGTIYKNAQGEKLSSGYDYREYDTENRYINCSKLDCSKKFRLFIKEDENGNTVNRFEEREIETKTAPNGTKYGQIIRKSIDGTDWQGRPAKQYEKSAFIVPGSSGFYRDNYNDRDLNTDTKQINLDFDKEFEFWGTEHYVTYGGSIGKTKKSMVNRDGYTGGNVKWWADYFYCGRLETNPSWHYELEPNYWPTHPSCSGGAKNNTNGRFSYLIPVTTKNTVAYFGDRLKVTNWLGFDLNYRYDKVKHLPKYDTSVPVPKGLIAGVFVPLPGNSYGIGAECGYNTECMNKNVEQNLAHLLKNNSYKHHSYNLALNLDPLDWMRLQFKYSNGFRAPTSDEVYMTFKHPSFSITPNVNLKAEVAKTKEVALTFYKDRSYITLNGFRTDYDNFIDLVFKGLRAVEEGSAIRYPFYQNINRDKAKVTGFEVTSRLELGDFSKALNGFRFGYKLTHQKGRIDGNIPMNAIQPTTMVFNLGYSIPSDRFGIDLFVTNVAAKKDKDTYNMYWKSQRDDPDTLVKGQRVKDSMLAWRSGKYTVLDAIVYFKPWENVTLTLGGYNLTNQSYITWDSARSIRGFGTLNLIDQNTGAGIKRFYAPGRNFKLTGEITF